MIVATFTGSPTPYKVRVSGHAGYGDAGEDIVCAAVTSAVQLCANGITEVQKLPAKVQVGENHIAISLPAEGKDQGMFLQALCLHMQILAETYPGTIQMNYSEV